MRNISEAAEVRSYDYEKEESEARSLDKDLTESSEDDIENMLSPQEPTKKLWGDLSFDIKKQSTKRNSFNTCFLTCSFIYFMYISRETQKLEDTPKGNVLFIKLTIYP